MKLSEEILLHN